MLAYPVVSIVLGTFEAAMLRKEKLLNLQRRDALRARREDVRMDEVVLAISLVVERVVGVLLIHYVPVQHGHQVEALCIDMWVREQFPIPHWPVDGISF